MSFDDLMTDTISLIKKNGDVTNSIRSSVQARKIFIEGSNLLIEPGDLLQRKMSNGGQETYEVINPVFYEAFHEMPANYQIEVKKLGLPEASAAIQNITYNISGNNSRFNQNSIDNSINTVNINQDIVELISEIRRSIDKSNISSSEKNDAYEIIDAVESQANSPKPSKIVISTLLSTLPHIASIAPLVTTLVELIFKP